MATTTNYGWETPDDTDLVKDGALAQRTTASAIDSTLGTALNNKLHGGLVLLKTQTVGSGVSSVTVTGAFSATYDDYKIVYSGGVGSGNADLQISLGGISSGYYSTMNYTAWGSGGTLNINTIRANSLTYWNWVGGSTTNSSILDVNIYQPFATKRKIAFSSYAQLNSAMNSGVTQHWIDTTNSASAFTMQTSSGTITGGTILVYGYAKD